MRDEYTEWLKAGNSRLSSVGNQPQQQGVGGVDLPNFWKRVRDQSHPAEKVWYPLGEQELLSLLAEIARLRARCTSLEAALRKVHAVDSDWHRKTNPTCSICAALDQHATTTQEANSDD